MQRYKFSKFTSDIGNQRIRFGQGGVSLDSYASAAFLPEFFRD